MKDLEVEKLVNRGEMLPLMEEFYTLQGEGFHKGTAAYFIRLGGCDVGCHWCDVKESWDAKLHPPTDINQIVDHAAKHSNIAIITGGEPTMYNLEPLTKKLKAKNIHTHIETSGAHPLTGVWDWVCLSPKKRKLPKEDIYPRVNELKPIIYNKHDFIFAEEQAAKVSDNCLLYLQPEWSVRDKIMPLIVEYVKANPKWKVSLQTHKYIDIP